MENDEDQERDHLLDGLQFRRTVGRVSIDWPELRTIFDEGNGPTGDHHQPESGRSVNLRCPYQANVMNTFDTVKRAMGTTLAVVDRPFEERVERRRIRQTTDEVLARCKQR